MFAVIFALPEESQGLLRILRNVRSTEPLVPNGYSVIHGNLGSEHLVVVHTGTGIERAERVCGALFDKHRLDWVISAGYAGGLDPVMKAEALILAENYSQSEIMAKALKALPQEVHRVKMANSPVILETARQKLDYGKQTGAAAVDMETEAIATLCVKHGVPLLSLRVITDTADEELAVPFYVCFDEETQKPNISSLLSFLMRNPRRLPGFIGFVRRMGRAQRKLTQALKRVVMGSAVEFSSNAVRPTAFENRE